MGPADPEIDALARRLAAHYPLVTRPIRVDARDWRITSIEDQDRLLEVAERLEHVPYGLLLWESAIGLARWLAQQPALVAGKRVLELGAGVGLAGLVAGSVGGAVFQTDHQEDALALARLNAHANGSARVPQFLADWRHWQHEPRYDVILGADILYEKASHPWLASIFRSNLASGGTLLLADPDRPQAMEFLGALEQSGLRFQVMTASVSLPGARAPNGPVEVALVHGRWLPSRT